MNIEEQSPSPPVASRISAPLVVIFLLSGVSGLIYQVVWVRMLVRVFGITTFAISTVLAVFMAGLALGSLGAGKWTSGRRDLLRAYAIVELGIGATALLSTLAIGELPETFQRVAISFGDQELVIVTIRFLLSALVLLPPTFLMGATLPLLSGHASASGRLGKAVAMLYGVNTLGAVLGVLASGFVLLLLLGERGSVLVGVALNFVVGAIAWTLARTALPDAPSDPVPPVPKIETHLSRRILILFTISGFSALAYEVIWSRVLTLILGNSVYAFSSMLAVYLAGIALGSLLISRWIDRLANPLAVLGVLEVLLGTLALFSIHVFVAIGRANASPRFLYSQLWSFSDFGRLPLYALAIVLPSTLLLGMIFPVVTRLYAGESGSGARAVAQVYGFNTVGSIAGSFVTGFLLIPFLGTLLTFIVAACTSVGLGIWAFTMDPSRRAIPKLRVLLAVSVLLFATVLSFSMRDPFLAVLLSRLPATDEIFAHVEHKSATVTAVSSTQEKDLYINGLYVSSTGFTGRFMTHMPLLFHPAPKKSLIICLGVGEAFRASQDHHTDTTVVELVSDVVGLFPFFHPDDHQRYLGSGTKSRVVVNDGRNYLLGTNERTDFVLVDGSPPIFASGMVNMYSLEFVQMVREHLSERGIFALWVPMNLFESDFWMITRNFTETFAHVQLWKRPGVSGVILMGTPTQEPIFDVGLEQLSLRIQERGLAAC